MQISQSLLLLALLASATAQQTFVVPSKANTTQPGVTYNDSAPQSWPFYGTTSTNSGSRVQYLYDVTDIALPAGTLSAVAVRLPANNSQIANSFQTQITLSVGPNTSAAPSTSFAANHGLSQLVFLGPVSLPATTASAWPTPWQTPIAFGSPFPYVSTAGSSLVIEFETTSSSAQRSWTIEGYRAEVGSSRNELFQSNCRNSGNLTSGSWGWTPNNLVPGGSLGFSMGGYPPNVPSLASNIMFVSVSGLGSQVGPFVTPFDMGLIAPSQPNCRWAIDLVNAISFPAVYQQSGTSASMNLSPALPIPNIPFMRNKVFYTQNLALDVDPANNLVLFPSIAIRWLFGTNNKVPVGLVRAVFNPAGIAPASGTAVASEGASLQFVH